jgi:hypothetical protein
VKTYLVCIVAAKHKLVTAEDSEAALEAFRQGVNLGDLELSQACAVELSALEAARGRTLRWPSLPDNNSEDAA